MKKLISDLTELCPSKKDGSINREREEKKKYQMLGNKSVVKFIAKFCSICPLASKTLII